MDKLLSAHLYLVLTIVVLEFHHVNGQDGIPSAPINLMGSTTATSITLTWEHLGGPDVTSYEINYIYILNECSGVRDPPVTVMLSNSSQRSYTIENGSATPVEEDSDYSISLTAINSVGRSPASNTQVTTPEAAPGIPERLQIGSMSVTNITIQWDRVNCRDRNGHTDGYRVVYYPSSNPSNRVARTVVGTGDNNRMFSIIGLPPRTSYTFEVQASNPNIDVRGDPAFYTANTTVPQDLGFLLNGQLYPNNSIVTVTEIGTSIGLDLYCLTPSLECCSDSETPNAASVTREWYLPDGRPVTTANSPFIKSQVSSAVSLYRNRFSSVTAPSGVYRCEIPDASGTSQNIYVGIYPQRDGFLSITSLLFDRNSTTLTCTSTGGPPTTVTWRKDGQPINETLYEQSQRLVDAERATYENVLFNDDVANFVGSFTCEVSNVRSVIQETTELNGVSIVRDQLNVGASATASCFSDAPATRMEWLHNGVVVASDMSTQQLDLVFSPVNDSIHNQVYICRVTREGGAQAEQNFTAIVDVPPNAIVTMVSSSGTARAGMVYNLTCTVSETVIGLINSPTATWTDVSTGMVVSNGNGITIHTTTDDVMSSSMLTFDPLRTSHEGSFVCSGTLISPALEAALMPSTEEDLEVQISTPDVVIRVPPGPLFAGSITPLTLICNISINTATDTDIAITDTDVTWLRGSSRLSSSDNRVTISTASGSRPSFTSTLTLDPLSIFDNATFTCQARARPPAGVPSFVVTSGMGEGIMSIVVNFPSPPTVSIDPFNSLEMAGQPLTLNCSASIQEGIRGTPVLTWTREGASLPSDVTSAPPLLSFPSLHTSYAGRYTCTARLSIPGTGVDVPGTNTTTVMIEIPQPPVTISSSPGNNVTFFVGLTLTFSCVVVVHPAVDTGVMVRGNWERNGTQLQNSDDGRFAVNNNFMQTSSSIFQISITINSLNFDDAGTYSCSATVTQQDSNNFVVVPQSSAENQRAISVQDLPPPDVDVALQQPPTDGCGEARILNCTSDLGEGFNPIPTIMWIGPNDSPVSTDDSANPRIDTESNQLIFSDIIATNSGLYKCRVSVGNDARATTTIVVGTTFPGMPRNTGCSARSGGSTLSFSWEVPTNSQSGVVGYQVEVEELRHRSGTREVEEFSISEFFTEAREVIITQGLAPRIPYNISVKALNLAGCGEEREISCFAQEGVPPAPENVEVVKLDRTSIEVRWKKFTLVELQGLANYNVTYSALSPSRTWQTIILPWSEYSAVVRNLNPGTRYRILVSVSTTAGEAGPVQVDYRLPLDTDSTTELPGVDSEPTNIVYIVVGVVIAVLFVLIILTTFIIVVFLIIRRRKAKLKFEKNRMLRAFDQPAGIMLTKQERQSMDMDKEEEAAALEEKPPSSPTDECELVQSPVHVPVTFGTASPQKESTKAEDTAVNANGSDLKQP